MVVIKFFGIFIATFVSINIYFDQKNKKQDEIYLSYAH